MSFTTTNMFAPRIWGYDFTAPRARIALNAGWSRADLLWESQMERGCAAAMDGDRATARRAFRRAWWVAHLLPAADLRGAATIAALGVIGHAPHRLAKARKVFETRAVRTIESMQIAPRARSSLFHLRMEARHRDTYHANMRLRFERIAAETAESLAALEMGHTPPHRLYSRWLGERPTVYDDTRKVLSACLLIPENLPAT